MNWAGKAELIMTASSRRNCDIRKASCSVTRHSNMSHLLLAAGKESSHEA